MVQMEHNLNYLLMVVNMANELVEEVDKQAFKENSFTIKSTMEAISNCVEFNVPQLGLSMDLGYIYYHTIRSILIYLTRKALFLWVSQQILIQEQQHLCSIMCLDYRLYVEAPPH